LVASGSIQVGLTGSCSSGGLAAWVTEMLILSAPEADRTRVFVRICSTSFAATNNFTVALPLVTDMLVLHQVLPPLICHIVLLKITISHVSPAAVILKDTGLAERITSGSSGSSCVCPSQPDKQATEMIKMNKLINCFMLSRNGSICIKDKLAVVANYQFINYSL